MLMFIQTRHGSAILMGMGKAHFDVSCGPGWSDIFEIHVNTERVYFVALEWQPGWVCTAGAAHDSSTVPYKLSMRGRISRMIWPMFLSNVGGAERGLESFHSHSFKSQCLVSHSASSNVMLISRFTFRSKCWTFDEWILCWLLWSHLARQTLHW